MNAISTAIDALFADPNLAVDVTYIPQQGANKQLRAITRMPDEFQTVGFTTVEMPLLILEVKVSDCPAVYQGDRFVIGQNTFVVQGEPRRDTERLTWKVDCYAP